MKRVWIVQKGVVERNGFPRTLLVENEQGEWMVYAQDQSIRKVDIDALREAVEKSLEGIT